ncbi:hypothetical protein FSP39_006981 [Pinctada imbricata]|uniref:Fibronectin type-III domain-containing protein n=1 Tax=Pinctada imbricata TaxID=66713 RepID=A0AA88YMI5_PINIB|nr:hypothetical protein FSP39_006981 [Pinctada imbricata]
MASSIPPTYLESVNVESSTTTSIHLTWQISDDLSAYVRGFRVHYQKEASKYVQYGPLLSRSSSSFDITNLVADTFYKVCLVMYKNDTSPMRQCVGASTTNWRLPVSISIGSSIGAVLALSMIVILVLAVARCPFVFKFQKNKKRYVSRKYDSMSSHFTYDFSDTVTHDPDEYISEDLEHSSHYDTTHHNKQMEQECDCNKKKSNLKHKCNGGVRPKIPPPAQRRQRSYISQTKEVYSSTESQPPVYPHRYDKGNTNENYNIDVDCPQCMYSNNETAGIGNYIPECNCENCLNMNRTAEEVMCQQCEHDGSIVLHLEPNNSFHSLQENMQAQAMSPDCNLARDSNNSGENNSDPYKTWCDRRRSSSMSISETESSELLPKSTNSYELLEIKSEKCRNSQKGNPGLLETCIDDV